MVKNVLVTHYEKRIIFLFFFEGYACTINNVEGYLEFILKEIYFVVLV